MKSLPQTLQYRHHQLILRIQRAVGCPPSKARALFEDLKAWLWLCAKHRSEIRKSPATKEDLPFLRMLDHFKAIDLAWHEFILLTPDYIDFCEQYLGGYIHHVPALIRARSLQQYKPIVSSQYFKSYFGFIHKHLGAKHLDRWVYGLPIVKGAL